MIARAQSKTSDHTTGTPVPAQICQGPAEGDNDASPFAVIEPAIWSETDREEEKSCNSGSAAAGVQSLPSVKVCTMETPLPLCAHVRLSKEVLTLNQNGKSDHQSLTQQREDGKEDLCQSFTEPLAGSITTNETHNNSSCHGETGVSHDTVGHQLKESDRSGCFHVSPERMKTKEVEYLQAEITRTDGTTEIKENGGMTSFEEEIRTGEQPENSQDTEEATETSSGNSIRHRTEGKTSKYDDKLTHVDDALKNILGFLSDHPYNAVILPTEEAAGEEERKEEASVGAERDMYGSSEIVVEREKEDMPEEWISERTEGHNLTLGSQREQEHKLSCVSDFQHTAETYVVDNRDDPSTLTAFPFNGRLPGGIDTFERIQLSLDGDEDGLSESLLLSSLPEQLLTSPQQQLHKHEEVPQEEEEETSGRHPENKAKGFSGIYSMCNEVPDWISAAAEDIALVRPEQPANCGRTHNSPECFQGDFQSSVPPSSEGPASDVDDSLTFEKKELFNKVLKELNLFFSISTSDFTRDSGASSSEQCVRVSGASDRDNCKEDLSIAKLGCYGDPSPDSGLEMCAGDPDVSPTCEGEQEVPLGSHLCTEETHKEPPQRKRWSPSFPGPPLLEQLGYTGADEAAGASANMQPAHPGRTLKESQDQTPAPPALPGGFAALNRTERRVMAVHVLCSLLHRSPGSGSCFFIQVIR
uniref:uncharacterized protein LOC120808233 isoform X1 n=1 Tax=Gasterosteus aculeatus aculeatus TaxID=481459 RepID=UPI001A989920|nr:uncharacterized protein LOC120808233 isoform X1 [Gasterosteus aculeatus aculeatus]XP_040016885.1 uncharacterized protein LOC120808233 isoform X1 [Gasterosteus aculeatus aculeatus]XP_040016886.1 uncharacterized protein LOC120808233 isoform X1 [Gasterosteus aculeatus aculeatus]XP_040016887.1 uncharacterized protein LOC120808233 isoform X1 [Gasterosteus aculeatus aculeatus]XP_040016888.1 uncharacterized protein LOC120808233 isoform X1 [Gasterosteus aculeatus aculeatus]XP_040016889.1 uncharacte